MKELGFFGKITELIQPADWDGFKLARVVAEHKERYIVQSQEGTFHAEITGNLRFSAQSRSDFPAVGDWVKITMMDKDLAIILQVFPRTSVLERKAVGKFGEIQLIAANIDVAFIVQAVDRDFNMNRAERYLAVCRNAQIQPVLLLSKIDLIEEAALNQMLAQIQKRIKTIPVLTLSSETQNGYEQLTQVLEPYKTYCFLGSSGVGKSTIVNHLAGHEVLKTNTISFSTQKGRHTTSHRELLVLPNKSIVVDTPGMREIGLTDNTGGVELTYDEISKISKQCRFTDCSHTNEKDCAVLQAVEEGIISEEMLANYRKLVREQIRFSSSIKEKRQKSREQGKLYKAIMNEKKKNTNKY